ncbi:MAG: hypothetical protein HOE75_02355 [Chloroflexi bacterium]|jgi:hypothetical protein|nr:hypothetical protein [Chloroflexota bacterium]
MTFLGKSGHQRAFLVALIAVGAALVLSVVSFANTSTSSTVTVSVGGVGGEFGFSVGQGTPATTSWASDATTTVTVSSVTNFNVGDYILIDEDADGVPAGSSGDSFHTITAINGSVLTVSPDISNTYSTAASVSEEAPNSSSATWSPSVGSTSSITAGNHFLINLQGLGTTDSALIEVFLTNTDELVKNYTFLHRLVNVQVLCDSGSCPTGAGTTPFSTSGTNGVWQDAVDAAGTTVSATDDYLTLTNARQAFILLGGYTYALTIDGGTLFTIDVTETTGDSLSPTDLVQLTAL